MSFASNMTTGMIRQMTENPGVPFRYPSVALLTLNSADRSGSEEYGVSQTLINNFKIYKPQILGNGYFTRIALTEINMPWSLPNVNQYNNTFTIVLHNVGYANVSCEIPVGFYTKTRLASVLAAALNTAITAAGYAANYIFSITIEPESGFFTFTNTIPAAGFTFGFPPINARTQTYLLNEMMGFIGGATNALIFGHSITGSYPSMLYTPFVDIVSDNLTKKQQVQDSSTAVSQGGQVLARIYLTPDGTNPVPTDETQILGCRPFTIHREFQTPKQIYWDTAEFINQIDIRLTDSRGNILAETPLTVDTTIPANRVVEFGSGSTNWQLTFQLSET
jgi:hypothetical protein